MQSVVWLIDALTNVVVSMANQAWLACLVLAIELPHLTQFWRKSKEKNKFCLERKFLRRRDIRHNDIYHNDIQPIEVGIDTHQK